MQRVGSVVPQILLDQVRCEPIEPGSDRRVRREDVAGASRRKRRAERDRVGPHQAACAIQDRQCRVSLVEMAHVGLELQGLEKPPPADPQHDFLLQPQLRSTSVKLARDTAASGEIGNVVAVEQVQVQPAHLHLPRAQPEAVARHANLQPQPFAIRCRDGRDGQLTRIIVRIQRLLSALLIDRLAKVALLVQQTNPHDRYAEIARGLELISCHIAQAPCIDRQSLAQHEFHAEVGGQ